MYFLNESLPFLLNRAGAAMAAAFTEELHHYDLSLSSWRILAALWSNGAHTLKGLSQTASVEVSTLSRQVAALVDRGLVLRSSSAIDWRAMNLGLTSAGRELVEELIPLVGRHEMAALAGISDADIRKLKQLLVVIYANLIALDEVEPGPSPGKRLKPTGS